MLLNRLAEATAANPAQRLHMKRAPQSRGALADINFGSRTFTSLGRHRRAPGSARLSFLLLVRLMVTNGATCRSTKNAVIASNMARHSAHNSALDAAPGLDRCR